MTRRDGSAAAAAGAPMLAYSAFIIAVLIGGTAIALDATSSAPWGDVATAPGWTGAIPGIAFAASGAVILVRTGRNPIGIVLAVFGCLDAAIGLAGALANRAALVHGMLGDGGPADIAAIVAHRGGLIPLLTVPLLTVLLPDGRLPTRERRAWRRPLAIGSITAAMLSVLLIITGPIDVLAERFGRPDLRLLPALERMPVLPLPDAAWPAVLSTAVAVFWTALVVTPLVLITGDWSGSTVRRLQRRWLIWAVLLWALAVSLGVVLPYILAVMLLVLASCTVAATVATVVTRQDLRRIDRIIAWSALALLLTALIVGSDALIMALASLAGSQLDPVVVAVTAAVVSVIALAPVQDRVVAGILRLLDGRHGDPFELSVVLAERLEAATSPAQRLDELAGSIARAFRATGVRVELQLDGVELSSSVGSDAQNGVVVPVRDGAGEVGTIRLALARRPSLTARDEQLLEALIRQTIAAIRSETLRAEVQSAREQLVLAREEERQRLRRDLHDGLGPVLAGVRLRLDTARNLGEDAARAQVLELAAAETGEAVETVRRVVHGLRPPALDDLGFTGAVQQLCRRLGSSGAPAVRLDTRVGGPLGAAHETAVYLVVAEALNNVIRHADAETVQVEIAEDDDEVVVSVTDDGVGMGAARDDGESGLGLRSMRERVAELGGRLTVSNAPGGGTAVTATLPIPASGGAKR